MNSKAPSATPLDPVEEAIFNTASELVDPQARAAFLDRACTNDAALRARLEALLRADQQATHFFADDPLAAQPGGTKRSMKGALPDQAADDGVGMTIGRYKLLEKVGEGGCGVVYVAEQTEPVRRRVALKVIKLGMDSKQVIARFEAERQALAMMDHPNIARMLDAGTTDTGQPYFVMELVRGIRITDYCEQNHLSTKERLDLFIRVCQAIQHAHQKGIIHRDIKPSNLLVTLHDGVPVPKVIDFGIAKAIEGRLTDATVYTQLLQIIGTPAYMSPEQAEMSGLDVDTRSDIYSLGVLLYELLVGTTPFDAKELMASGLDAMRKTIREKEPVRPSTKLSQTLGAAKVGRVAPRAPLVEMLSPEDGARGATRPTLKSEEEVRASSRRLLQLKETIALIKGDLDWIVMKCLEKDRTRRYETANGLAMDIQRHLNHEPVRAMAPTASYKLRKFVRRNRTAVAVIVVVAALLIAGIATSTALALWARRAERQATKFKDETVEANTRLQHQLAATQQQRVRADAEKSTAERHLYAAKMNLAQQAAEQNNLERLRQLLGETGDFPGRGFEWYYWQRQAHFAVKVLRGHIFNVNSVAFSPDGDRILTGSSDRTAKVWDADSGREVLNLGGHNADVLSAAWSANGQSIVTSGWDHTVYLWDAANGQKKFSLSTGLNRVSCLALSRDGRCVLIGGFDETVTLRELPSGREILKLAASPQVIRCVAFSPDGSRFATAGQDHIVSLWDSANGKPLFSLKGHLDVIASIAFSPDGRRIATGSNDGTTKIWDAATGHELFTLRDQAWFVSSVAFSPDGLVLATGSRDWTVKIRNASDGKVLRTLSSQQPVSAVAFSPDSRRVAAGCLDGSVWVWELRSPYGPPGFLRDTNDVALAAFSPDGQRIVTFGMDPVAKVWETATGRELFRLKGHARPVPAAAFSPDGRRIVTASNDGTARVWDAATGTELLKLIDAVHPDPLVCVTISPDGRRILTGGTDNTVKLWDADTGMGLGRFGGFAGGVRGAAFSPDGLRIAVVSGDHEARIMDATTGKELLRLRGHSEGLFAVAFSPDGRRIVTGGSDQSARVWEAATGRQVLTLEGHTGSIWSAGFSPDGKRIITGSEDKTTRVWDAASGSELLSLPAQTDVRCVFAPDGRHISATDGHTVHLWSAASPVELVGWANEERAALEHVADLRRRHSETAEKQRAARARDEGVIKQCLMLAPIPIPAGQALKDALSHPFLADENRLKPRAGDRVTIAGKEFEWRAVRQTEDPINFDADAGKNTANCVGYAVSYLRSDTPQNDLRLLVAYQNIGKVYLNGELIQENPFPFSWLPDEFPVNNIRLNQGLNVLLVKAAAGPDPVRASIRFTDSQGNPLRGINVTLDP